MIWLNVDGFARNVKKTESIAIDTNTKALLEQVALVDVLDGWRDGILTIGTFGFDPLKPLDHTHGHYTSEREDELEDGADDQHDCSPMNDNDDDDNDDDPEEDEEVNPLMSRAFSHSFEDLIASNAADYGNVTVKGNDAILTVDGVSLTPTVSCSSEVRDNVSTKDGNEKKKKRTTLAELFSEESEDIKKKENPDEMELKFGKKQYVRKKNNGLAIAKKLIPHLKEDSHPVKKLNQVSNRIINFFSQLC